MTYPILSGIWLPLTFAALVAFLSPARATILASSYDGVNNDGCAYYGVGDDSYPPGPAFSAPIFSVGAKFAIAGYGNFRLARIILRLRNYAGSANPNNYRLSIVRDNSGHPDGGEVVWSGSPQGVGPADANYSFTLTGTVQGGQDYWLLFDPIATDAGQYWWAFATSPLPNCGQHGSRDLGILAQRWSTNGPPTMPWFIWPDNEIRPAFLIEGSPLPQAVVIVSPLSDYFSLTNWTVIAPNNSVATVVLNGLYSYDPENRPLEFVWLDGTNLLATTAITTNLLAVGSHQISLVVSDDIGSVTNTIALDILAPGDAVRILMSFIESVELVGKNKLSLNAILLESAHSFDRGGNRAGVNQLLAFQNKVKSQIARFDYWTADWLTAAAQEIINDVTGLVERPPSPHPLAH